MGCADVVIRINERWKRVTAPIVGCLKSEEERR